MSGAAIGGVAVGVESTLILRENRQRMSATVVNDSDTTVYLSLGVEAVLNQGIRLNANGGSYEINLTNPWPGRVFGIAGVASKNVVVTEVAA